MKDCKYFNDPERCQYCNSDDSDRIVWRSAHKLVAYSTYRFAVIVGMLVGLYIGFVIGSKL